MATTLSKGDRIRLKVRTASGFNGYAIVLNEWPVTRPDETVEWRPEGCEDPYFIGICARHHVAKCRDLKEGLN